MYNGPYMPLYTNQDFMADFQSLFSVKFWLILASHDYFFTTRVSEPKYSIQNAF